MNFKQRNQRMKKLGKIAKDSQSNSPKKIDRNCLNNFEENFNLIT